jgi:hypothetical protein
MSTKKLLAAVRHIFANGYDPFANSGNKSWPLIARNLRLTPLLPGLSVSRSYLEAFQFATVDVAASLLAASVAEAFDFDCMVLAFHAT